MHKLNDALQLLRAAHPKMQASAVERRGNTGLINAPTKDLVKIEFRLNGESICTLRPLREIFDARRWNLRSETGRHWVRIGDVCGLDMEEIE